MSKEKRINTTRVSSVLLVQLVIVLILSPQRASAQNMNDAGQIDKDKYNAMKKNPTAKAMVANIISKSFANLSQTFGDDIKKHLGFCILDLEKDWSDAFNFSTDTKFIEDCIDQTQGDLGQRLCTAADIKFYFTSLFETSQPNKNCNLSSWVDGCEAGWACKATGDKKVDLRDSKDMPLRTDVCAPCCAGFFCPHGLTCMMPCPLGAYCPSSTLNKEKGVCDPYRYQLSPDIDNRSCGAADVWADITSSKEMFCSAGSYCRSTIEEKPCQKGFYCRTGSTAPQRFREHEPLWMYLQSASVLQSVKRNQKIKIFKLMAR